MKFILMIEISTEKLKPGSFMERHLFSQGHPSGGIPGTFIVLPKYLVLSQSDVERIRRFNFDTLLYDEKETPADVVLMAADLPGFVGEDALRGAADGGGGETAPGPDGFTAGGKQSAVYPAPVPQVAKKDASNKDITIYGSLVALLNKEFGRIARGEKIEGVRVLKISSIIIEYTTNVREEAILHVAKGREKYRLEVHSVNVGILAALLGQSLRMRGPDLTKVVAGAIMHDVGIVLMGSKTETDVNNYEALREHASRGFRYLRSMKNLDPPAVIPAFQHHEKAGGDGYPQKLTLKDMEPASKVVALCDSFDNQITFIRFGNDPSIHFSKDEFIAWKKEDFDQELFNAFIKMTGELFRNHAPVILNDGSLALIKEVSVRFPFAPVVQIVADENGNKVSGSKIVDLRKTKGVWMTRFVKRAI
jgi:HD-GYP domain-containing protein (c-di-GMP phosphodiesterase class II)